MPFNFVFCSVIETGNLEGLESRKALIDALELLSCAMQLDIFRALYTVAVVHTETRGQSPLEVHPPGSMPGDSKDPAR
jgi:hypothetical protein